MGLFGRKNKQPEVTEKILMVEKKYDEEFIKDFNEFLEYWNGRKANLNNRRGITVKPTMCDTLDRILNKINI